MKIRLLLALVLMTFSVFGQNIPSYVPTNGLVGWWPFNGNANDESGNGNNGLVNGATLTNDRFGNGNMAYEFDGVNDIINSTLTNSLQGNWSISFWYKSTNSNSNFQGQNVIGLGSDMYGWGGAGFQISGQIIPGQCPTFNYLNEMYLIDASQECGGNFLNGGIYSNNTWYNVIIVKTNSNYDLIINNTPIASNILLDIDIDQIIFGNRDISFQYFNGHIDDIGIWNRALTQQEITNLYNASLPNTSIPIFNCPGAFMSPQLASGLVGWWPFCGDADDESGNGNNGTVNGATLTSDRFGNGNSAYEFDGVDDLIEALGSNNYISDTLSISLWMQSISTPAVLGNYTLFELGGAGLAGVRWGVLVDPSNSVLAVGRGCGGTGNALVSTLGGNGWRHYLVVVRGTTHSIYENGIFKGNSTNSLISSLGCSTSNLFFGVSQWSSPYYYSGKLDDIGIWNRALDSSEVAQLYNTGLCTQTIAGSCDTLIFNANITGFNPVTYANQVKVYPNPASDNLVIDCGTNYTGLNGYSIRITNLLGQTVYNSPVTAQITNIQLNSPTWVNGTYVVQFVHPNGTVVDTKRIIIQ
jgi:hypothetical protein